MSILERFREALRSVVETAEEDAILAGVDWQDDTGEEESCARARKDGYH